MSESIELVWQGPLHCAFRAGELRMRFTTHRRLLPTGEQPLVVEHRDLPLELPRRPPAFGGLVHVPRSRRGIVDAEEKPIVRQGEFGTCSRPLIARRFGTQCVPNLRCQLNRQEELPHGAQVAGVEAPSELLRDSLRKPLERCLAYAARARPRCSCRTMSAPTRQYTSTMETLTATCARCRATTALNLPAPSCTRRTRTRDPVACLTSLSGSTSPGAPRSPSRQWAW